LSTERKGGGDFGATDPSGGGGGGGEGGAEKGGFFFLFFFVGGEGGEKGERKKKRLYVLILPEKGKGEDGTVWEKKTPKLSEERRGKKKKGAARPLALSKRRKGAGVGKKGGTANLIRSPINKKKGKEKK